MVKIKGSNRELTKKEKINIFFKSIFSYFDLKRYKSNSFYQKKAMGRVAQTILVSLAGLFVFIGLQSFIQDFYSNNVDKSNLSNGSLTIEGVKSNILYVNNTIIDNLSIRQLRIDNIFCNISGQENLRLGINFINISLCRFNLNNSFQSVKIITKAKTIEKSLDLR